MIFFDFLALDAYRLFERQRRALCLSFAESLSENHLPLGITPVFRPCFSYWYSVIEFLGSDKKFQARLAGKELLPRDGFGFQTGDCGSRKAGFL